MKFDEQQHEISAKELGATELPKPIKKVIYLFFTYLRLSFEVKINNKEIKVKTGK